jgi:PEP-CTERM motif
MTVLTIGLTALGLTFAVAQPAEAASLFVCSSVRCGSASANTTFSVNDFEGGFDVNGSQVQIGLGNPTSTSVSIIGSFVDGAAKNTFSGLWIANRFTVKPDDETIFFTNVLGEISDVLHYNYSSEAAFGVLSGFVIVGTLSATDLAALDIVPTEPPQEVGVCPLACFGFGNRGGSDAFIQPSTVPEPSTWAMMLIGFAGLGYAGWRAQRNTSLM